MSAMLALQIHLIEDAPLTVVSSRVGRHEFDVPMKR